ncbi:MAG: coxL, partial [Dehalococcoidia bacterium]|nr:coxL [Dehalococcoidia bacterium]
MSLRSRWNREKQSRGSCYPEPCEIASSPTAPRNDGSVRQSSRGPASEGPRSSVIGKSVPRVDGPDKVMGKARYTADFTLPRMLHARVLRSPYPYARIVSVDTSRAEKLPGVKAVVSGKDASKEKMGVFLERPILAQEVVRFVGEAVAAVAAETLEAAEEAIDLIDVEYEELKPVLDPEESMKPNPEVVIQPGHGQLPRIAAYANLPVMDIVDPNRPNIYYRYDLAEGDLDKGFREADLVVENRYTVTRMQHCALEPHAALAQVDPDGSITVWASEQHPYEAKGFLARIFGVPPARVRVIAPYIGGGFGGKLFVMAAPISILLSSRTGRPVKLIYSREETFVDGITDVPMIMDIKDGVKKDGTLVARKIAAIINCGAYVGRVVMITENVASGAAIVYKIPHFRWDSYAVAVNEPPAGPLRGFGGVQLVFALESQMDILAEKLGMDAAEFRRKNLFKQGDENILGMINDNMAAQETLDKVLAWLKKDEEKYQVKAPWRKGVGFALEGKTGLVGSYSLAAVKVHSDGTIELR